MKKLLLFLALMLSFVINAQVTTVNTQQKYTNVPAGTANDSLLVRGSDQIMKTIPKSKVIDVFEYANLASFPVTGLTRKIYVDKATDKLYRWNGSTYSELSAGGGSTPTWGEVMIAGNITEANAQFNAGAGLDFFDGTHTMNVMNNTMDANQNIGIPNGSGTLALKVNGLASDTTGNVQVPLRSILYVEGRMPLPITANYILEANNKAETVVIDTEDDVEITLSDDTFNIGDEIEIYNRKSFYVTLGVTPSNSTIIWYKGVSYNSVDLNSVEIKMYAKAWLKCINTNVFELVLNDPNGFVPYTGATEDVDLGSNYLDFHDGINWTHIGNNQLGTYSSDGKYNSFLFQGGLTIYEKVDGFNKRIHLMPNVGGIGVGTNNTTGAHAPFAWIKSDNTTVAETFQFPDKGGAGGTFAMLDDIVSGGGIVERTKTEIDTLIANNELIVGTTYKINGVHKGTVERQALYDDGTNSGVTVWLKAISTNKLETKGVGKFYTPKYEPHNMSLTTPFSLYNIWNDVATINVSSFVGDTINYNKNRNIVSNIGATAIRVGGKILKLNGDWTSSTKFSDVENTFTATIDTVIVRTYEVDSLVNYGGYVWKNINGNIGTYVDDFNLEPSEWLKLPFDEAYYNVSYDAIEYDYEHDWIGMRSDNVGNVVSQTYVDNLYQGWDDNVPSIKAFQWGNVTDYVGGSSYGTFNNKVINSYFNCINFQSGVVVGNILTQNSAIYGITFIYDGSYGYFENNFFDDWAIFHDSELLTTGVYTNMNTGSIFGKAKMENGYIQDNTFDGQSNIDFDFVTNVSLISGGEQFNSNIFQKFIINGSNPSPVNSFTTYDTNLVGLTMVGTELFNKTNPLEFAQIGDLSLDKVLNYGNESTTQDMFFRGLSGKYIQMDRGQSATIWNNPTSSNSISIQPDSYYQSLPDGSYIGIDSTGGFNYNDFTSGFNSSLNQYNLSLNDSSSNSSSLSPSSLSISDATNSATYSSTSITTGTGTYTLPTGSSSTLATVADTNKGLQEVTDINSQTTNNIIIKDVSNPATVKTTIQDNTITIQNVGNIATLNSTGLNFNNGTAGGAIVLGAVSANHTYTLPSIGVGTYTFAMTSNLGALEVNNTDLTVWNNGKANIASNTSFGDEAMRATTTSSNTTGIGYRALRVNTTGSNNTAIGHTALDANLIGNSNTAVGSNSLGSTTGGSNTAIGADALTFNTTGISNVAIGADAGNYTNALATVTTPINSIYIGNGTRAGQTNPTNEIVIGDDAVGNGNNSVSIGNSSTVSNRFYGNINTTNGGLNANFGVTGGEFTANSSGMAYYPPSSGETLFNVDATNKIIEIGDYAGAYNNVFMRFDDTGNTIDSRASAFRHTYAPAGFGAESDFSRLWTGAYNTYIQGQSGTDNDNFGRVVGNFSPEEGINIQNTEINNVDDSVALESSVFLDQGTVRTSAYNASIPKQVYTYLDSENFKLNDTDVEYSMGLLGVNFTDRIVLLGDYAGEAGNKGGIQIDPTIDEIGVNTRNFIKTFNTGDGLFSNFSSTTSAFGVSIGSNLAYDNFGTTTLNISNEEGTFIKNTVPDVAGVDEWEQSFEVNDNDITTTSTKFSTSIFTKTVLKDYGFEILNNTYSIPDGGLFNVTGSAVRMGDYDGIVNNTYIGVNDSDERIVLRANDRISITGSDVDITAPSGVAINGVSVVTNKLTSMTTSEITAIATPVAGEMYYNTTLNTIVFYNGTSWQKVTTTNM